MRAGHDMTIRIRRNAPVMWTGAVESYGNTPRHGLARMLLSPRDLVPTLRHAFTARCEPFVWVAD